MYEFKKYVNHTIRQGVMNTKYFQEKGADHEQDRLFEV